MPACITHHVFAKDTLQKLDSLDINPKDIDENAYFWGAQGPDFFFCHKYFHAVLNKELRSVQEYGSALHRTSPALTLQAMQRFVQKRRDLSYLSYVLGFICHYSLDSTAHPYVNCLAQRLADQRPAENASAMHGEVESSLDAIVLRWKTGLLPSALSLGHMFPKNQGVQRKIACLYREVLFCVYGEDVSEEDIYKATKDARFVFKTLTDRTGLKRGLFNRLERGRVHYVTSHIVPITEDADVDFANTAHAPWQTGGGESKKDFFQLYQEAEDLALRLAGWLADGKDFSELTDLKSF